ncbi:hypothetical protein M9435_003628 [Picochlorum sp. BPE23]|nr:hypothetical protein M9435_003628 [Picochlorum sp. BPE23]
MRTSPEEVLEFSRGACGRREKSCQFRVFDGFLCPNTLERTHNVDIKHSKGLLLKNSSVETHVRQIGPHASHRNKTQRRQRCMCTSQSDTHSSLLLASISSSGPEGNSRASAGVGREQASVSRRHAGMDSTRSSKIKYDAVDNVLTSHALNRGEIHRAGAELQKVVAFVGGMLLAGVSKAQHHVERSKRHLVSSSFSDSFSFPWKPHRVEKETKKGSAELASNLASRGLEYEQALDVRAAVQCFEEAVKLNPNDLFCLCLAAKQWSDLTFYHDVMTDRERQVVNMKALEYAERAIVEHPNSPGGYLAMCISKGRLGLFMDNKTKVKLAKEAQEAATTAIRLGPDNDVAHHLMGRWHYEMSKLNVVVRTIVRVMYGTSLAPGTKEEALESYKKAVELAPKRLIHQVETGRVLLELGQKDEAKRYLLEALEQDIEDINAWQTRFDAEEMLAQIDKKPWTKPSLVPPGSKGYSTPAALSTAALLGVPEHTLHGKDK